MVQLTGTIPNQSNNLGTLAFDFTRLQNGPSDGIALVNAADTVVEFLSYEGTVLARNGRADGMTSTDIGVSESNSSTPVGHALQRRGSGNTGAAFTWHSASASSRDQVNAGQTF